ncbi:MAG TPA: aminotransferase class IV [Opitutaceae bacterium]|nr:aminotransferase class IV [Opitutaceae bacterium]
MANWNTPRTPTMECPYIQANSNGRLHDAREPGLPALDRGFLHGDSVYEVWRTYDGAIFAFDEHWLRLERSARALAIPLLLGRAELAEQLRRTAAAFVERTGHVGPVHVRAQFSRGGGVLGLDPALAGDPHYLILVQRLRPVAMEKLRGGLRLTVAREVRRTPRDSLDPSWKTGNSLNNLLGLREAHQRGADDVLLTNHAGRIAEASTSNVFFVRKHTIVTPPLGDGLLAGVTRALLLDRIAERLGAVALEESVTPADLGFFDGCFLTSTTKDLVPVAAVDDQRFATGDLSLVWKLKAAFQNFASEYALAHPELRFAAREPAVAAAQ